MIQLYVLYDKKQDKLIAEMETPCGSKQTLGAVNIKTDGNFYKNIIVAGNNMPNGNIYGLSKWWKWAMESDCVEMSDEFPFHPDDIEIRCLEVG